ncbi:hypothetical protein ACH35V_03300 [Actinomadura sp. 1N219]|uniref:hypothetical protein n=1 Tax=Actinomadura sp. 1N219 TaxID=3375152 RepID=UPI0037B7F0CF
MEIIYGRRDLILERRGDSAFRGTPVAGGGRTQDRSASHRRTTGPPHGGIMACAAARLAASDRIGEAARPPAASQQLRGMTAVPSDPSARSRGSAGPNGDRHRDHYAA